ncbi:MAG: DUF3500 domain-containing protein [Opitutae bacterium]
MRKVLLFLLIACLTQQTQVLAHISGEELSAAANKVLNSLNENQRAKACFDFDNKERTHWIYVPSVRLGLPIKELTEAQQKLVQDLLATSLSPVGKNKVLGVQLLEEYLRVKEQGKGQFVRDPGLYYISFFGTPTANGTWGWRWEGHHCSQNFTIVDGKLTGATPSFVGANPGKINDDKSTDNGFELLAFEDLRGRELARLLTPEQFKKALIKGETPKDVVTKNTPKLLPTTPQGISLRELLPEQKKILGQIIMEYVGRARPDFAIQEMKEISATSEDLIYFGWSGGLEVGQGHYYCVQGPSFLFELDNTQNNSNHVHTVWRDLKKDFGYDVLAEHLNTAHGK